jgi:hypothetical protein
VTLRKIEHGARSSGIGLFRQFFTGKLKKPSAITTALRIDREIAAPPPGNGSDLGSIANV